MSVAVGLTALPRTMFAQSAWPFAPRANRVTDAVISRDIAWFDSLSRAAPSARATAYIDLARESYERNDDGRLTAQLLDASSGSPRVGPSHRADLWALVDSVSRRSALAQGDKSELVLLEVALVRARPPLIGAPSCAAWEREVERLADGLRRIPAPSPTNEAPRPLLLPVPPPAPRELRGLPSRVHFALDRAELAPSTRRVLDALVDSLAAFPDVRIALAGHTDARASDAYNEGLSRRRALAVQAYLVERGIVTSRVSLEAAGKSRLDAPGTGVPDHARNRRVMLRFITVDGRDVPSVEQLDDLQPEGRP